MYSNVYNLPELFLSFLCIPAHSPWSTGKLFEVRLVTSPLQFFLSRNKIVEGGVVVSASTNIRFCRGLDHAASFLDASTSEEPAAYECCRANPISRKGGCSLTPLFIDGAFGVVQMWGPPTEQILGLTFGGSTFWVLVNHGGSPTVLSSD